MDEIKLGIGYKYDGGTIPFSRDKDILNQVEPVYKTFEGFSNSISDIKEYEALPKGLKEAIEIMELRTKGNVVLAKNGPDRNQYIEKKV